MNNFTYGSEKLSKYWEFVEINLTRPTQWTKWLRALKVTKRPGMGDCMVTELAVMLRSDEGGDRDA